MIGLAQKVVSVRFVRFLVVGGLSSATYALVVALLLANEIAAPALASIVGYLIALVPNFLAQKLFTFRSTGPASGEIPRYLLVQGVNIGASTAVMHVGVAMLGWPAAVGIVVVVVLIPVTSYLALRLFVFTSAATREREPAA